jgi:putative oxidoreductase
VREGGALTLAARLLAAAVFVPFGIGKFVAHGSETHSFRTYGLPAPSAFAYVIGVLELAGGLLLLAGRGTRLVAAALAVDMIGAIAVSGVGQGEAISLTLAPAMLAVTVYLAWAPPSAVTG